MAAGSVWWVARAVNSRVTKFVQSITRASKPLFELLPPQRAALREQGLDQASRAVVIDLPTSGGKTTLAEFRILQALNQFDADKGWVAYVANSSAGEPNNAAFAARLRPVQSWKRRTTDRRSGNRFALRTYFDDRR